MSFTFDSGCGAVLDERIHPSFGEGHCFIAVTPPIDGNAVLVNFTTIYPYTLEAHKELCLDVDDHPFLTHPSYVAINYADVYNVRELERRINSTSNVVTYSVPIPQELHGKIIRTLMKSKLTPKGVKKFLTTHFGEKTYEVASSCYQRK